MKKKIKLCLLLSLSIFGCTGTNIVFEESTGLDISATASPVAEDILPSANPGQPDSPPVFTMTPLPTPTLAPTATPVPTATPTPSPTPTPTPTPTPSPLKTDYIISGTVYDRSNKVLNGVTVYVTNLSEDVSDLYKSDEVLTVNGVFEIEDIPPEEENLFLVAKRAGFGTVQIPLTNTENSVTDKVIDFKGLDALYDEPFATLKINETLLTAPGDNDIPPSQVSTPAIGNLSQDGLSFTFEFSELVDHESVEKSLEIVSEPLPQIGGDYYSYDGTDFIYNWTDLPEHSRVVITLPGLLDEKIGASETKFRLHFRYQYKDKSGKSSLGNRKIKYSRSKSADYAIFSIENEN